MEVVGVSPSTYTSQDSMILQKMSDVRRSRLSVLLPFTGGGRTISLSFRPSSNGVLFFHIS